LAHPSVFLSTYHTSGCPTLRGVCEGWAS
jgi:hypothetical protein